jgi:hypothetical protein
MKIWYFVTIILALSSFSLASAYEITNDSKNVVIYRDEPEFVLIEGYVPEDIYELYPPILVTVTEPDGNSYVLEFPVAEKRQFEFPIRFDENSIEGQHKLEISYRTKMFHTVSIDVSKSKDFKPTAHTLSLYDSSKYFSAPMISSIGESYFVTVNVKYTDNNDHIRLNVENRCAGNSQIHSQDYRLTKITSLEFDFEQLSMNKPDSCMLIFSVYDTELTLIDFFYTNYDVNFKKVEIPEKIIRITPEWVKSLVGFWVYSKISDDNLSDALNYMVKMKIIQINYYENNLIDVYKSPVWFKQNAKFWIEGSISDEKFLIGLEMISEK